MTIPGYLGRVLSTAGTPIGTCFQVAAGLLVTACHVLDDGDVLVSGLGGGDGSPVEVLRRDRMHDLAVLRVARPLPADAGLAATDTVDLATRVVVTGVSQVDDHHTYAHLDAPGEWAGSTVRDGGVLLGRLSSKDVLPGMSGAPVRRLSDDVVLGVVSGRFNSADGWLRDSVWVARTEDLRSLLSGVSDVPLAGRPLGPVVDLTLAVGENTVRLTGAGIDITETHGGVGFALRGALGAPRRAGRLLAESFLPGPVGTALSEVLHRAEAEDAMVRIGVAAPEFAYLPWEALHVGDRPLALRRSVVLYRGVVAPRPREIPGPLRIVVAIASPQDGGPVLDYERELRNILAAVRGARHSDAQVRVVTFATTTAIRAELTHAPAHVLHLSGHGLPGELLLEDDDGRGRLVTAARFVDEAIPPGRMPPVVTLAACHTHEPPAFSAGLLDRGASVVIGTESAVSDRYSTRFFARVYGELATAAVPDVVAAVAEARRLVQMELADSDDGDEWSVITVHAGSGTAPLFDPARSQTIAAPTRQSLRGLLDRGVADFVGRRREQRELPDLLLSAAGSGVVLHGIGGIGKTTLAARLVRAVQEREPARRTVVCTGELSVDGVLTRVAATVRRAGLPEAAEYVGRIDQRWQDRFDALREDVLDTVPLVVVLDNFEDNLSDGHIRDTLLAALLDAWARDPGQSRLLITCRYPVPLPGMTERPIGPMSLAETMKLIWSLPALDVLDPSELQRVWRIVGGHPRTLEYLDALLAGGQARFRDVTDRLEAAVGPEALRATPTLDVALAQTITVAANDVLLDELLAGLTSEDKRLLLELSVYREPVAVSADVSALVATGLVAVSDGMAFVHRWTATELARRWGTDRVDELRDAHRKAANYWREHAKTRSPERMPSLYDQAEARYHLVAAQEFDQAAELSKFLCLAFQREGVFDQATEIAYDTLRWLGPDTESRATLLHLLGMIAQARGDYDDAKRQYEQSLAIQERRDDLIGITVATGQLGGLALYRKDLAEAERRTRQALEISERLTYLDGMATGYQNLAAIAEERKDFAEAERLRARALAIQERLGDLMGMGGNYHGLAMLAQRRGDLSEAERLYRQALELEETFGSPAEVANTRHNLGAVAARRGDLRKAEQLYYDALNINEQFDLPAGIALCQHSLGRLARDRGEPAEAMRLFRLALEISMRLDIPDGIASNASLLGSAATDLNQLDEAVRYHLLALGVELDHEMPQSHAEMRLLVALRARMGRAAFDEAAGTVLQDLYLAWTNELLDLAEEQL